MIGKALSPKSREQLEAVRARLDGVEPGAIAARVRTLVAEHVDWRRCSLNLLASENAMSRGALALLSSPIATRLTEGLPGDKEFPPARHNVQIDEIEAILIALARRLIPARFVEWRAASNTMANAMALEALTEPGDTLLVQALEGGGNMSYHPGAVPDLLRLRVQALPPGADFGIDLDIARTLARSVRPKVIVVGGSYFLFPLPLAGLREIADEVGASILYDAAHVGLLISFTGFQDPLREGADAVTLGTHKIMGGPIGGLVFLDREDLAARILNRTYPLFLQTRDQNKYAAAAHALAELVAFGREYAGQMVRNAQALGAALEREGFAVLGRERGYTLTHQVVVDVREIGGEAAEGRCQASNILLHKGRLPGYQPASERPGLRITVQELTRQGMEETEMAVVARLIARAVLRREPAERLQAEVGEFAARYQTIRYSFDAGPA